MELSSHQPTRFRFQSRRPHEAHGVIASFFEPQFKLEVEDRHGFDFSLDHFPCGGGVSLSRLAFRADVHVEIDEVDAFMVQMPLAGSNELRLGGRRRNEMRLHTRLFSVIGPQRSLRQRRSPDCRMVLVRFNASEMASCLAAHVGPSVASSELADLDFAVEMPANASSGSTWLRLASYLLGELDKDNSIFMSPLAASQAGQLLMSTLLRHQPHNYSELLNTPIERLPPRLVRDAEGFLEAHAEQPITTDDIARHLNISSRSVYLAFRRHLGRTPMERLKDIRMSRVRADLLAAREDITVTSVAMAWGFTHFGKFAAEYRARFGELPSETLRSARAAR